MANPTRDDSTRLPILLLVGPTGSGKTAVAIELCRLLDGEIISADSMQIYRHCDICTAKPSPDDLARAPHHLIDLLDPWESYSAARWAHDAAAAIVEICSRGKQPLVVGGTGFYIRALLQPQSLAGVPPDLEFRRILELEAAAGSEPLHARLREIDPAAAQRLHPNDVRRIIRALEVARSEGNCLTESCEMRYDTAVFGLDIPRPNLYRQLNDRVDAMVRAGAVEEVRRLLQMGVPRDAPVLQGVGYRQILPTIDNEENLPAAVDLWKRDTRRYAKRQLTWFRHQLAVQWIPGVGSAPETAMEIAQLWRETTMTQRIR